MKLLRHLRARCKLWKDRRFLKSHGCSNWRQYYRRIDPDRNTRADRVTDYYHGYPYVHCFSNHNHPVYYLDLGYDGTYVLDQWCLKNLKHKFRMDALRAFSQTPIGPSGAGEPEWWINEIGGGDYLFAAFKDPVDYQWFMLRWA